jgi:hypothetical protein
MRQHSEATYKKGITQRFSGAAVISCASSSVSVQSPQVVSWSKGTGQVRVEVDGTLETLTNQDTLTDTGFTAPAIDRYTIGCTMFGAATPTYSSGLVLFRKLIFNRKLTATERARVRAWAAAKWALFFGRKRNLSGATATGGLPTYVIPRIGQSNGLGLGATIVQPVVSRAWTFGFDNVIRPAFEPSGSDGTASPPSPIQRSPYSSTHGAGQLNMGIFGQSMGGAMLERMRASLPNDLIDVPCCVGSTPSASWAQSATTDPPPTNGYLGFTKHRMLEVMRNVPNPVLAGIVVYQMESDATQSTLTDAGGDPAVVRANYVANWNLVLNELISWIAAQGWTWRHPTLRFWIFNGAATNITSSVGWDNIRTGVAELVAGRTDSVLVEGCDGPWIGPVNVHIDTGTVSPQTGQLGNGDKVGALLAAS